MRVAISTLCARSGVLVAWRKGGLSNTAVICFVTNALDGWGAESKLFTWLIMEHAVLAVTNCGLFGSEEPPWLKQQVERNKYVVDKHLGNGGSAAGSFDNAGGHGNLDADDLNLTSLAESMLPIAMEKVEHLKDQLRLTDTKIGDLRRQLKKAMEGEIWNDVTGVSESTMVTGLALGMLKVTILSLSGVGTDKRPIKPENTRIIVALKATKVPGEDKKDNGYEGQPGPAPVVSRKGAYPKSGKKVCKNITLDKTDFYLPLPSTAVALQNLLTQITCTSSSRLTKRFN